MLNLFIPYVTVGSAGLPIILVAACSETSTEPHQVFSPVVETGVPLT